MPTLQCQQDEDRIVLKTQAGLFLSLDTQLHQLSFSTPFCTLIINSLDSSIIVTSISGPVSVEAEELTIVGDVVRLDSLESTSIKSKQFTLGATASVSIGSKDRTHIDCSNRFSITSK